MINLRKYMEVIERAQGQQVAPQGQPVEALESKERAIHALDGKTAHRSN